MTKDFLHFFEANEFLRYLADLIVAEIARMRPSRASPTLELRADFSIDLNELGLDSLERLQLAISVAHALQLQHSRRPDQLQRLSTFDDWVSECRQLLRGGGSAIGFRSSGSDSAPRLLVHEVTALAQEIEFLAERFAGAGRIVSFTPAHHIYGFLFTVLLPLRLEVPTLDARAHSVASLQSLLCEGDLLIAFPTLWEAAAQAPPRWPGRVVGVTSGAPCDPHASAALRASGLASLVEVYGSTETGGVAWREDAAAYRLFPYWSKRDEDSVVKWVGGDEGLFTLPDFVDWRDARSFLPLRRRDGAVQVAGVNVYPNLVRSCLMAHEEVADARVRLMEPHEGVRLKAYVVPKRHDADLASFRAKLERWVEERLSAPERPRAFDFGAALPVAASGKPADWPIQAQGRAFAS